MTSLHLTGLKGHHPLGFLAACGLLRCCSQRDDAVKLGWTTNKGSEDFAAILSFQDCNVDQDSLKKRLIDWLLPLADDACNSKAFSWSKTIRVAPKKFREAATQAISDPQPDQGGFFASFASDLVTSKKGELEATAFDMTSGKQEFLGLLKVVANSLGANGNPLPLKHESDQEDLQSPPPREAFKEALFGPWRYRDNVHSHGRDPTTQRLHALMDINPNVGREKQGIPGVRAALFLAGQALPLFPCFAANGRLRTTGFHHDDGDDWFSWPIWRRPIALDTLRSLLAHPFNSDLRRRGVEICYRCRRVRTGGSEGNYQIFSHSEQRPWPSRKQR